MWRLVTVLVPRAVIVAYTCLWLTHICDHCSQISMLPDLQDCLCAAGRHLANTLVSFIAHVVQIATLPTGEIDYAQLEEQLRQNVARPAIINVNIGTTVSLGNRMSSPQTLLAALLLKLQLRRKWHGPPS